ncbi:hypothetical protein PV327_006186 [Microctonus hyperodae]|uniref:Uncharacterized protein n=1 Tax=Microctonus hyperodae TaxID=165561 RepID=A0AA39F3V5_MICHY|nr:hypothetical protein PV327_006186 [Microctonus hyperodae]
MYSVHVTTAKRRTSSIKNGESSKYQDSEVLFTTPNQGGSIIVRLLNYIRTKFHPDQPEIPHINAYLEV